MACWTAKDSSIDISAQTKHISSKNPKNVNKRKHLHNNFLSDVYHQNRSFFVV